MKWNKKPINRKELSHSSLIRKKIPNASLGPLGIIHNIENCDT
jgi:hypothetical protein